MRRPASHMVIRGIALFIVAGWVLVALTAPLLAPSLDQRAKLDNTDPRSISLLPPFTRGRLVPTDSDSQQFAFANDATEAGALTTGQAVGNTTAIRFWLGTDRIGGDLAWSLAHGARTSLLVGLLATVFAISIGITVGATAGLSSPTVDALLMRFVDAMLAFPMLLLVLMLDLLFDPGVFALIVILGAVQWMGIARVMRAEMLRLRSAPFVLAARGIGQHGVKLFTQHLLPNALQPILVSGLLLVGNSILLESAVAFLGFGTATDLESWGRLVDMGRPYLLEAWWISALPGSAIVLVVTSINILGEVHQPPAASHSHQRGI